MILDVLLVAGGAGLGHHLFVWWAEPFENLANHNLWIAGGILSSAVIIAGSMFGLYDTTTLWSRSRVVARCLLTVLAAMAVTWLIMHVFMYSPLSRRAAASGVVFFLLVGSAIRLSAHQAVQHVRRGLLVVGQGPLTGPIIRSVRRGAVPGYRLVGIISANGHAGEEFGGSDIPVVGDICRIESVCCDHDVAEVVVAETAAQNGHHLRSVLNLLHLGCRVTDETTFYESCFGEIPVSHITPHWFLAADLKGQLREHAMVKRVFDVMISAVGLVLTAPLIGLIAAAIWLRNRGAVFYSQVRVGQGGRPFILYKFRTMRKDAEANGSAWAQPDDPRATPIGRFLRRSRLDELPQLWNILRGDMSVVGPRPERPEFVAPLSAVIPFYEERHLNKPGLTGWAQINYPYGSSLADARRKLQLDLYYIKHTSLELDLVILLRTFGTFFLGSR